MPVLWAYARDLYQTPGFGDTINFAQTKEHYYKVHTDLNPSKIVPDGPDLSGWLTRTAARNWAGTRSATGRRRDRRLPQSKCRRGRRPAPPASNPAGHTD